MNSNDLMGTLQELHVVEGSFRSVAQVLPALAGLRSFSRLTLESISLRSLEDVRCARFHACLDLLCVENRSANKPAKSMSKPSELRSKTDDHSPVRSLHLVS